MPYGLPKPIDTEENNKKIELCVLDLTGKGKDKETAIRICKASVIKGAGFEGDLEEQDIEDFEKCKKKYSGEEKSVNFYRIESKDEYFDIKGVEIFQITGEKEQGIKMDDELAKKAIEIHAKDKSEKGYLPSVFIGHNTFMAGDIERPAVGFIDNLRSVGGKMLCDIVNISKNLYETVKQYPYRSMEMNPKTGEIAGLALLGSSEPYFKNAPLIYENQEEKIKIHSLPDHWENGKLSILNFKDTNMSEIKTVALEEVTKKFENEKADVVATFEKNEAKLRATFEAEKSELLEKFAVKEAELKGKIAKFEEDKKLVEVTNYCNEKFLLSENVKVGFGNKEGIQKLVELAIQLTPEQQEMLYALISGVRCIEISSYASETPKVGFEDNKEDKDAKLEELTQKYMNEQKMSRFDAMSRALSDINS